MATIFGKNNLIISEECFMQEQPGEPAELRKKDSIISETLQIVKKSIASRNRRLQLRTLAHIVLWLRKPTVKSSEANTDVTNEVAYWRSLALCRGEQNDRLIDVINLQKERIEGLERDLENLVDMAQDTQKLLAEIGSIGNSS